MLNGNAGLWTLPLRGTLRAASIGYGLAVRRRNARFDRPASAQRVSAPVISVGNITVGGTGKTPMVIDLLHRLRARGATPAVVARGYGGRGEDNDEQSLINQRCPFAIHVTDPDRVRGATRAIERGANRIVLDDGFQHRRLARDLDIVLIDATCPFGYGFLLPRGLLREPLVGLRRAHAVVLTRCDQVRPDEAERIRERLWELAPHALHLRCRHRVSSLCRLDGAPVEGGLRGRRVVLFAGIANPAAFAATIAGLGATVVGHHWWPDHHRYSPDDLAALASPERFPACDDLVTTEKDGVKLSSLPRAAADRIVVAKVDIEFDPHDEPQLNELLARVCSRRVAT
jgi:tetraacyldisaccharide 4'-kinase